MSGREHSGLWAAKKMGPMPGSEYQESYVCVKTEGSIQPTYRVEARSVTTGNLQHRQRVQLDHRTRRFRSLSATTPELSDPPTRSRVSVRFPWTATAVLVALFTNAVERLIANLEADIAPRYSYYAARALLLATDLCCEHTPTGAHAEDTRHGHPGGGPASAKPRHRPLATVPAASPTARARSRRSVVPWLVGATAASQPAESAEFLPVAAEGGTSAHIASMTSVCKHNEAASGGPNLPLAVVDCDRDPRSCAAPACRRDRRVRGSRLVRPAIEMPQDV